MRKRFGVWAAGLLVAGSVLAPSSVWAQDVQSRQLKLAFLPTADHPIGLGAKRFAELVAEKTGGKMKIKPFPGGTLGGDLQVVSALQGGTVEMTILVTSLLAGNVKDFTLLDSPFLFDNEQEADAVLDGPVGEALLAKLPEKGLVGLGYFEYGFRDFTNNRRPVEKVEDLQGLKIRVSQTPLLIDFVNALGANATPMPIPEVYTALETGAVDGMDAPLSFIRLQKYDEVQKHLAVTKHLYNAQVVLVSKQYWDGLSVAERKVLQDAMREAQEYQRQVSREQDAADLVELKETMQVTELPPAEIAKMRELAKPLVDKYSKEIDPTLVESLRTQLNKIRGQN
ncbi:MAG: TRAP transporter substrate-binding protein [Geminicoccaceae bacterium]